MSWWSRRPWSGADRSGLAPQPAEAPPGRSATEASAPVPGEAELAERCQQYLQGRMSVPSRDRVPVWMPLSWLAHADRAALAAVAAGESFGPVWRAATAYLAADILASTGDGAELRRLQQGALVPLELDLLGHRLPAPRTVAGFVSLVSDTVQRFYRVPT